ncbi:MAG TPA: Na+/H+ antiporter [Longimicrobiales bacterium]|nr:Na+/H+ antiporter [Longimicrobiales bacterium]
MAGVELILILLAVSAALQILAWRWRLPHPILLVLGGAILALVPGLPRIAINPEVVFLLFVPPLLYWTTAFTTSLREFRREIWPIARLGVGLVLVTIVAVAVVAHALEPRLPWAAAFALGAIVAPPDPVAATAVMRPLRAPAPLVSILEGEGLINDATALVAYRTAVAAVVTGSFSPVRAGLGLVLAGVGGVAVGLLVGAAIVWVRRRVWGLTVVENTVSLLTPFAAYLPADAIGASGVLAVVATGLYIGRRAPLGVPAVTRLQAEAMWRMVAFILESLIFILIGFELAYTLPTVERQSIGRFLGIGLAISGVVIVVRLLWVFPSAYLGPLVARRRRGDATRQPEMPPWKWVAFVGWAGVRGGDSLVIALALPLATAAGAPFPGRVLILLVTFAVIFATLVVQGITLGPLLHLLRLREDESAPAEEAHARRVAAEAALNRLAEIGRGGDVHPAAKRRLRHMYAQKMRRWGALDRERHGAVDEEHRALKAVDADGARGEWESYRRLASETITAERRALVDLRDRGVIDDAVLRRIQRDLDLETALLHAAGEETP